MYPMIIKLDVKLIEKIHTFFIFETRNYFINDNESISNINLRYLIVLDDKWKICIN